MVSKSTSKHVMHLLFLSPTTTFPHSLPCAYHTSYTCILLSTVSQVTVKGDGHGKIWRGDARSDCVHLRHQKLWVSHSHAVGWVLRMRLYCVSLVPTLSTIEEGLGARLVLCVTCDVFCHEIFLFHYSLFHRQVKGGREKEDQQGAC